MLIKAFIVAFKAHRGQKDKGGKPYILHPLKVAFKVRGIESKTVALLHDTVEDTYITLETLKKSGFPRNIILAVDRLTKRKDETYAEYLSRVKHNRLAKDVKIADLQHNSNLKRLKVITKKDIARAEKYSRAIEYLRYGE